MALHIQVDHVGSGLDFDTGTNTLSATGGVPGVVFDGRYITTDEVDTDQTATFIDVDTNADGETLNLRDEDHAAGMHYHIRVDVGTDSLTIQRKSGSTKTISGNFAGQSLSGATSFTIYKSDGIVRLQPDGSNWKIY